MRRPRGAITTLTLVNRQQRDPVPAAWLRRVTAGAMRRLKIRARGTMVVAFVDSRQMARLNRRFTGHRGLTDVLSFRYDEVAGPATGDTSSAAWRVPPRSESVIGEVIVSPAFARTYAKAHGLPYRQELARYTVHGLLHWLGHDDRTPAQQRKMRVMEDDLLRACAAS